MAERLAIDEIRKILQFISKGYKVPDIVYDTIKKVAKREVEDKERVVLVKRDPDIGNGRIQAMYVKIIDGATIEFYPPAVVGFGADFDGDSVSVLVPISEESQKEAKKKMVKTTSNEGLNTENFELSKEMLVGLYALTDQDKGGSYMQINSVDDLYKYDVGQRVRLKFKNQTIESTVGRFIFNAQLPLFTPFYDEVIDKKSLRNILSLIIRTDKNAYADTINKLVKIAFYYATIYPQTISIDMMGINDKLQKLKERLAESTNVEEQSDILDEMKDVMMEHIKTNAPDLYAYVKSGASKGGDQVRQILVSKGLISDPSGNILPPIQSSISDGYKPEEYFNSAAGARAGIISKALGTAEGGYEYRKVIYVVGDVRANINLPDCGTKETLNVKLTKDLYKRMSGRRVLDNNGKIIPISEDMIGNQIRLRSPIYCQSKSICRTCYGDLLMQLASQNVGIISAQEVASLAERFMKSFHTGGMVSFDKVNIKKELMINISDTYEDLVQKYTHQEEGTENILYLDTDNGKIEIDTSQYTGQYKIDDEDDHYKLPIGIFYLTLGDNFKIPVSIERELKVYKTENIEGDLKSNLVVYYTKGDKLFHASSQSLDYSKATQRLDELISGKAPTKDVSMLYGAFYRTMAPTGGWDSVHLEVLIGNCLRWSKDPQVPARLKRPFDFQMFPIKQLPSIISWPLGLAFENMGAALQYGLISDRGETSEIEKVILGEQLRDKK